MTKNINFRGPKTHQVFGPNSVNFLIIFSFQDALFDILPAYIWREIIFGLHKGETQIFKRYVPILIPTQKLLPTLFELIIVVSQNTKMRYHMSILA